MLCRTAFRIRRLRFRIRRLRCELLQKFLRYFNAKLGELLDVRVDFFIPVELCVVISYTGHAHQTQHRALQLGD